MRDRRPKQTEWERGFAQGMLWGVAWLVSAHGEDTLAGEMLMNTGIKPGTAVKIVDEADRKALRKAARSIPRRENVRFTAFDERSLVSLDKLRAQGHSITELQVGDRTLMIPAVRGPHV